MSHKYLFQCQIMFSRKTSRVQKDGGHPNIATLSKRSSLMCLPETIKVLTQSKTPPPRIKFNKNKRSLSLESLLPDNFAAAGHFADQNVGEYFTDQNSDDECSTERVTRWSDSLTKLLSDRKGAQTFLSYLETEHSSENLCFWMECEKYKGR